MCSLSLYFQRDFSHTLPLGLDLLFNLSCFYIRVVVLAIHLEICHFNWGGLRHLWQQDKFIFRCCHIQQQRSEDRFAYKKKKMSLLALGADFQPQKSGQQE